MLVLFGGDLTYKKSWPMTIPTKAIEVKLLMADESE